MDDAVISLDIEHISSQCYPGVSIDSIDLEVAIKEWLIFGETGASSKTIAYTMIGRILEKAQHYYGMIPADGSDFRRCLLLLQAVPGVRSRLDKMRKVSPLWNRLINHWSELESLFLEETGGLTVKRPSPKTYTRLQELTEGR